MTSSYRLHGLRNEFIVNAALSSEANLTSEKKKKKSRMISYLLSNTALHNNMI